MTRITRFAGEHAFLSNFHPSPIVLGGWAYPTLEHAYQACKTTDPGLAIAIRDARTPGQAKRLGQRVTLRPGWECAKLGIMEGLLAIKFGYGTDLARLLLATGDAELVEGNTWGDRFWGVCRGSGENHLGRLLMKRRAQIKEIRALNEAEDRRITAILRAGGVFPSEDMVAPAGWGGLANVR
jgi:ribA/ribD-fused uncharacterized protein